MWRAACRPPRVAGALGTSVLVSVIGSRVGATLSGELSDAQVPVSVAHDLEHAADAVSMRVAPVGDDMPARLQAAVVEGAGNAFMNGVHTAVLTTGVLCVLGAILAAIEVRRALEGPGR